MNDEILSKKDLEDIEFTRSKRKIIINKLTEDNNIPTDHKELTVLLKALSDDEKTVFTKAKIRIGEKATEADSEHNEILNSLLKTIKPDEIKAEGNSKGFSLPSELESNQLVEGETEITSIQTRDEGQGT